MTTQQAAELRRQPPQAGPKEPRNGAHARPRIVPLVVLAVLAAAAIVIWRAFFAGPSVPDSIVVLSGRIDGDDSAIAPKVSGKILEIRVREGDAVRAGEVLAMLDDRQILAQEEQARAALWNAQTRVQTAREQIAVLQQELQQNELQTRQATIDAEGRVRQAQGALAAAQENLAQQRAAYQMAAFNRDAYTRLAREGAVSQQQGVQAVTAAEQQAAGVAAARRQVEAAKGALTVAQANLANPEIRGTQATAVQKQIVQQESVISGATAQVAQARAQLREAEANRADLVIRAPFSGTVITRAAEPGEVVSAGTAIVTLLNLDRVYLRGFVPEGQIGKVKIGQRAHVYLDSNPHQPIEAYVLRIDPEAMFTPENTYFRQDRVNEVVGLKLALTGAFGYAKPGMPADGEILVQGDTWPKGWHGQ